MKVGCVVFLLSMAFADAAIGATARDRVVNPGLYGGTEPVSFAVKWGGGSGTPMTLRTDEIPALPGLAVIEVKFGTLNQGSIKLAGLPLEKTGAVPSKDLVIDLSDRYRLPVSTIPLTEDMSRIPGPSYTPNPFLQESGFAQSQRLQADRTVLGR